MAEQYSRHAKALPPLSHDQSVVVQVDPRQAKWTPAVVINTPADARPRSYVVQTANGVKLQRNRHHIKATPDAGNTPTVSDAEGPVV